MKYTVTVGERTVQVEVRGDRILVDGRPVEARLVGIPQTPLRQVVLDGRTRTLAMLRSDDGWLVQAGGEAWPITVVDERTQQVRELTGQRGRGHGGGVIRAPMPGLVLRLEVAEGEHVAAGAGVVVLEAMKMENEIRAPGAGVVRAIHVRAGQAVEKGAPLVELVGEP